MSNDTGCDTLWHLRQGWCPACRPATPPTFLPDALREKLDTLVRAASSEGITFTELSRRIDAARASLEAALAPLVAAASLGTALLDAVNASKLPLHIMADGRVWIGGHSIITTEATRALAEALAASRAVPPAPPEARR